MLDHTCVAQDRSAGGSSLLGARRTEAGFGGVGAAAAGGCSLWRLAWLWLSGESWTRLGQGQRSAVRRFPLNLLSWHPRA